MWIRSATTHDGEVVVETIDGRLRLQAVGDRIMRVVFSARPAPSTRVSVGVLPQQHTAPRLEEHEDRWTASTGALVCAIDKRTGAFTWRDAEGTLLFREPHDGTQTKLLEEVDVVLTRFDPAAQRVNVQSADGVKVATQGGERYVDRQAYATTLRWQLSPDEAVYGLGQHEEGILNYRGHSQDLYQQNLKVAMPVVVSTRGYGIVWDSYSAARFADDESGATMRTEVDDELDFYVVLGPELDDVIAGIRSLTGRVPMLPRWALGYLQSKERYHDQDELIGIVREHRRRNIPLDCIVQDWQSWPDGLWGQKSFDPSRYPDPKGLCDALHEANVRLMVSVWPNMTNGGPDQQEMRAGGYLLGDDSTYDAEQQDARALYWQQAEHGYFRYGVDAWWADCTEPFEADWTGAVKPSAQERRRINVSAQERYLDPEDVNAYSLRHTQALYEGQRETDPSKRVMVLTRSASLGQQRYGAVTWSGDISATWATLRRQMADGLNFCLTGNPRWSSDIGAFFVGRRDDAWFWDGDFPGGVDDLGYRELYVRWLQLGTFLPLMRSHGTDTPREAWHFGEPGDSWYDTIVAFIRLRYRLLPYLYSLLGWETQRHYTSFRALAFDFRHDPATYDVNDQFMLGPSLMVCPVTEAMFYGPGSTPLQAQRAVRHVYLPTGNDWYDFWTGERHDGGRTIQADCPLERLPLYVPAGSLLPLGPPAEHTGASASGPMEIRVYPGADATFELYDDSGDGYGYEAGEHSVTELHWDEATRTLRIGERHGHFPGMAETVPARVVVVTAERGTTADVSHEVLSDDDMVSLDGRPRTWSTR